MKKVATGRAPSVSLSAEATYAMLGHSWPHNVRELEQRLKTAVVLAGDGRIERAHLWAPGADEEIGRGPLAGRPLSPEDDALVAELVERLKAHRGNVTHVGDAMGKSRTQVQRWLRRFGIDAERFRR